MSTDLFRRLRLKDLENSKYLHYVHALVFLRQESENLVNNVNNQTRLKISVKMPVVITKVLNGSHRNYTTIKEHFCQILCEYDLKTNDSSSKHFCSHLTDDKIKSLKAHWLKAM